MAELTVGGLAERTRPLTPGGDCVLGMSSGSAKEGNLLLGKCQTALSGPDLQSNQIVKEIAQVYKCTYLCVICWEVLWLGCSLILW